MESDLRRGWKDVLEQLSERKPPVRLNVLDTIALDRLGVCRPQFWTSTGPQGFMQSKNVRNLSVDDIVQTVVAAVHPKDTREYLAVGLNQQSRFALTLKTLCDLSSLIAVGLDGLVLLSKPGHKFDSRVFVHEIRMSGRGYEDTVQALRFPELSQAECDCEDEAKAKAKLASVRLVEQLLLTSRLCVRHVTLLYRWDLRSREMWLMGLENCVLTKPSPPKPRSKRSAMSVMRLEVSSNLRRDHSPLPPRSASRFFRPHPRDLSRAKRTHFAWGHALGGTFLLDSAPVQAPRLSTPLLKDKPEASPPTQALHTNESAFLAASFLQLPPAPKRLSKLNKSYSGSVLARPKQGVEEAYAPAHEGCQCWGRFCSLAVEGTHDPAARYLLPQSLLEATKDSALPSDSRLHSPDKTRSRRHKKTLSEDFSGLTVGKLVARREQTMLPVCLPCFLAYQCIRLPK